MADPNQNVLCDIWEFIYVEQGGSMDPVRLDELYSAVPAARGYIHARGGCRRFAENSEHFGFDEGSLTHGHLIVALDDPPERPVHEGDELTEEEVVRLVYDYLRDQCGGHISGTEMNIVYNNVPGARNVIKAAGGPRCFANENHGFTFSRGKQPHQNTLRIIEGNPPPAARGAERRVPVPSTPAARGMAPPSVPTRGAPPRAPLVGQPRLEPRLSVYDLAPAAEDLPSSPDGVLGQYEITQQPFAFNLTEPFLFVTVGVPGAGKSHSTHVVMEETFLKLGASPMSGETKASEMPQKVAALVFHYSETESVICETIGLGGNPALPLRPVVYVSPTYYKQKRRFYADRAEVRPLLFEFQRLQARQLKLLMGVDETKAPPLYMSVLMRMLREYQREDLMPTFADFKEQLQGAFMSSQSAPLEQRLSLLEEFLLETPANQASTGAAGWGHGIEDAIATAENSLVILDLSDPLVGITTALDIFQTVLMDFRDYSRPQTRMRKMVVLDEAHKYLSATHGFSKMLVELARQRRHEGTHVLVSTQRPQCLPDELLELATLVFLHHFHSRGWYDYLSKKLSLASVEGSSGMADVLALQTGKAMVFQARSGAFQQVIKVRERRTEDFGFSR